MDLKDYRKQLLEYVHFPSWLNPVAVTLTLKQVFHLVIGSTRLTTVYAAKNLRHFLNRLNRKYFGNAVSRYKKRLNAFPVLETSYDGRLHYHLLLDRPPHVPYVHFEADIRNLWQKTDWGYKEIHLYEHPNEGWLYYMTKPSQKPDYDLSIDWMNYSQVTSER